MRVHLVNGAVALVGGVFSFLFGGWSELLSLFLFVIVLDYGSGVAAAIAEGRGLNSQIGFRGLIKKFGIILIIALAHQVDKVLGVEMIFEGTIYFFIANELISITENYGRIGLPLPDTIKKMIDILKDKGDSKGAQK